MRRPGSYDDPTAMNVPNIQIWVGKYKLHKKVQQLIPGLRRDKHTVSVKFLAVPAKYSKNERICQKYEFKKQTQNLP